jgi:hypothetical protein
MLGLSEGWVLGDNDGKLEGTTLGISNMLFVGGQPTFGVNERLSARNFLFFVSAARRRKNM